MKKVAVLCVAVATFALVALSTAWAAPQTTCPVMGGAINPEIHVDYNGERIYFCCPGCPETFMKSPDKYLEKMKAEGVELEQVAQ